MKRIYFIIAFCVLCSIETLFAQNTNTMYFMDEISTRNLMNPAFLPRCKSYFDFILLPNVYAGAGENAFAVKDLFYKQNGQTTSAFSSRTAMDKLLNNMPSTPYVNADFRLNILNFGVMVKKNHYLIFDFNLRNENNIFMAKDMFRLAFTGMQNMYGDNIFDLKSTSINSNTYATAGVGYSGRLHKKVTFGFKAKFLLGLANATSTIDQLTLNATTDQWVINSASRVNVMSPIPLNATKDADGNIKFNPQIVQTNADGSKTLMFSPAGYGASFDIGLTYEPIENLTISAAVVDLGFINWGAGYGYEGSLNGTYKYDGLGTFNYGDSIKLNTSVLEELGKRIQKDVKISDTNESRLAMINGKFNAGVEYGILKNKISFGVMNQLTFNQRNVYDEVTLAVNFRPSQWFKAAVSYSFINGNWGTLGLGLNLNLGGFSLYLISDYTPITYANIVSEKNDINVNVPSRMQYFNIQTGVLFNLHRFERDLDNDGIANGRDKCPNTDMDMLRKKCPAMKDRELVDKHGCEFDEDGDGINDCFDHCPGTPAGVPVDSCGCPFDTDHDGILDYLDKCPNTPANVVVDSVGCPVDEDGDGVPDYLDKCPATPHNVVVDENGCPVDSDKDGVPDYLDKCPDTPAGVAVTETGCPTDEDGDGVPDNMDKCPETPHNVLVDANGCPVDTDGDGIPDYLDKCPDRKGPASNQGCPEPTAIKNVFKKAMHGIQFETGKTTIMPVSYPILNQMVSLMEMDTTYNLVISGHTDNVGNADFNQKLSEGRAASVRKYLVDHGINASRITAEGYGDTKPVASNKTKKGRAANRRVEFEIVYERVTYQDPE